MRVVIVLMVLSLVSCSLYLKEVDEPTLQPALKPIMVSKTFIDEAFVVDVWVDNLAPKQGSRVMLYGSLIKHGVYLGGMTMNAYWPEDNWHPRVPNCKVQVIYGSGVCIIETDDFQSGVPVPIRVEFDYEGKTFSGITEITPR